jgi:hypothetical protein
MAARGRWMGAALLLAAGCLPTKEEALPTVKPSPFGPTPPASAGQMVKLPKQPQASKEQALRVEIVGQKLIQANPQIGLRPLFITPGVPTPELYHQGQNAVYITEGLVKQCQTEAQLAALLAYELGRMVAEREVLASPEMRRPERLPPMRSGVGSDSRGAFGPADATELTELAKFDRERPRPQSPPPAPPDVQVLARSYLAKAGFAPKDLDDAAPLLRQSRSHNDLERQMHGQPILRPWGG